MTQMSVRRVLTTLALALAVVGTAGACTDSGESDDDAPSQQVPAQGGGDDDGDSDDDD